MFGVRDSRIANAELDLVIALAGDHVTDAAARVFDVFYAARDEMDVAMKNGLSGVGADVDADVETGDCRVVFCEFVFGF